MSLSQASAQARVGLVKRRREGAGEQRRKGVERGRRKVGAAFGFALYFGHGFDQALKHSLTDSLLPNPSTP